MKRSNANRSRSAHAWLTAAVLVVCLGTRGEAQDAGGNNDAAKDPVRASVWNAIDDDTFLVIRVNTSKVAFSDESIRKLPFSDAAKDNVARQVESLQNQWNPIKNAVGAEPNYVVLKIPASASSNWRQWLLPPTADKEALKRLFAELEFSQLEAGLRGHIGPAPTCRLDDPSAAIQLSAKIAAAWEAVGSHPVQIAFLIPAHVQKTYSELSSELPVIVGGGPIQAMTDLQWCGIGFDPTDFRFQVEAQYGKSESAAAMAQHLPNMLRSLFERLGPKDKLPPAFFNLLVGLAQPQVKGSRLVMQLDGLEKVAPHINLLAMLVAAVGNQTRASSEVNDAKQIVLAMHNYHDVHGCFPPNLKGRDKKGQPRLSWRVHLLPFLEQAELYNQFHLDEPWDSEHNRKLVEKIPSIFKPRGVKTKLGHTLWVAPSGDDMIAGRKKTIKISQFVDGTSNTIVLVQAAPKFAVPWTAPLDLPVDLKKPAAKLRSANGKFIVAFADGSVQQLDDDTMASKLSELFQMSDGYRGTRGR